MKRTWRLFFVLLTTIISQPAFACITCDKKTQAAIYDSNFFPNLFTMLSAFIVLAIVVIVLSVISNNKYKANLSRHQNQPILSPVPLTTASMVLGIGLGGFVDGIVLHQILQWHEMVSNKMPPATVVAKSVNMFWDGIFHAFCLIVVLTGIMLLWKISGRKDVNRSGNLLAGGLLSGWGIFNITEGIIDHQLLKLHNVREVTENKAFWNYGFLGISVIMIIIGYTILNHNSTSTMQNENF